MENYIYYDTNEMHCRKEKLQKIYLIYSTFRKKLPNLTFLQKIPYMT